MNFFQTSSIFLRTHISYTKFTKVFLCAYIRLIKLHVYFGYIFLCTEDNVYKSFVRIFVLKMVTVGLDVNKLATDGPDVSKTPVQVIGLMRTVIFLQGRCHT